VCHESDGTCVDPSCKNVDCAPPFVCKGGACVPPSSDGGCVLCETGPGGDSGLPIEDGSIDSGGLADASNDQNGGCGCATPGGDASGVGAFFAALAMAGAIAARRRRR
jgi:MYXO-CTERM domain-containing protein